MITLADFPTELSELICQCAAHHAFKDWEFGDHPENHPSACPSQYLSQLPLIPSRWTVPGQKALYRVVVLPTANRYKGLQESLTVFPHNGLYIREIFLHWVRGDFGGPDGYSYKMLGCFHEIEIQQLVRLCPLLESFNPGQNSPAISQEGIAALGNIDIRSIAWRPTECQQYGEAVQRAQLGWKKLEALQIFGARRAIDIKFIEPMFDRLRTFKARDYHSDFTPHLVSRSSGNLQQLELSNGALNMYTDLFEFCGLHLSLLTLHYPLSCHVAMLGKAFKSMPSLRTLQLKIERLPLGGGGLDWTERLKFQKQASPEDTTSIKSWTSESL